MKNIRCADCKNYFLKWQENVLGLNMPIYSCSFKRPRCEYYKDDKGIIRVNCKDYKEKNNER